MELNNEFTESKNIKGETVTDYTKDETNLVVTKTTPIEQKYAIGHINNMIANFQKELDFWIDLKTKYDELNK